MIYFKLVIVLVSLLMFSAWVGAGIALASCVSSKEGYKHLIFKDNYKVYCVVKE